MDKISMKPSIGHTILSKTPKPWMTIKNHLQVSGRQDYLASVKAFMRTSYNSFAYRGS